MRYFIESDELKAEIDSFGAELKSVMSKASNREYMWYGNGRYWGRTSPVLFPFVGNLKERGYIYKGIKHEMTQHGFARDMEFTIVSQEMDVIWFGLQSTPETEAKYPFKFELQIGYKVTGSKLDIMWRVINKTDEIMHFSIGAHPAFLCPVNGEKDKLGYQFQFSTMRDSGTLLETKGPSPVAEPIESGLVARDSGTLLVTEEPSLLYHGNSYETGLLLREERELKLTDGKVTVTEGFFDECTYIMQDQPVNCVSLITPEGQPVVDVIFDTPLIALWSPEKKNAPFVCIEPWYGRCDIEGFDGELADREYTNHIGVGEEFNSTYSIVYHEIK